jgi:hypothetical protein
LAIKQTVEDVSRNILAINDEEGNFYGTAFFLEIGGKKYCFTSHHCIANLDKIFVQGENKKFPAKWLESYSSVEKDIAVLEVINCPLKPLQYNPHALPALDVYVWGISGSKIENFPKGFFKYSKLSEASVMIRFEEKEISGSNKWNKSPEVGVNVFEIVGQFEIGFAGAPVCYASDNSVIGMFIAKDETRGFVIPIQTLLEKFPVGKTKTESATESCILIILPMKTYFLGLH